MKRLDEPLSDATGVEDVEAEVARARLSFEQGLREASRVGTRAARRMVTPALLGVGLAGGALLLLAVVRLARRPASDGALIRIVVETPRSPKRILPALGGAVARWLLERQLRGGGPLGTILSAVVDQRAVRERGTRSVESNHAFRRYES
ncbi:MAG TPA: hypothetical protein VMG12_44675 [Polyangiaceae bacterium]|nr:hypothetical protein [Polyangiaceae bacterium]